MVVFSNTCRGAIEPMTVIDARMREKTGFFKRYPLPSLIVCSWKNPL